MNESPKKTSGDTTHTDIEEILAKRREMLNRVRADLRKIDELQAAFRKEEERRLSKQPSDES